MIVATEDGFCVQGRVAFDNVLDLRFQGEKLLMALSTTKESITIDLSEMKDQDASALSLLLCWLRFAPTKNKLHFVHLSQSLQRMSKLFGLVDIL